MRVGGIRRLRLGVWPFFLACGLVSKGPTIAAEENAPPATPDHAVSSSTSPEAPPPDPTVAPAARGSVEDRLRRMEEAYLRMEAANRRIQGQYNQLLKKYETLDGEPRSSREGGEARPAGTTRPASRVGAVEYQDAGANRGIGAQGMGGRTAPNRESSPGAIATPADPPRGTGVETSPRAASGIGAQGTGGRVNPAESSSRADENVERHNAKVEFAQGLELSSADDEFKLTFHNLTQAEFRGFPSGQQGLLHSQFFIPRQRWYFTGRVTRNVEYYTDINRGYGSLDILDAFVSYRFDEHLQLRVGRMKTPYLYEYYSIAEGDLFAPERSMYAGNLSGNRQDGLMALGELFDARTGYAIGVFNGPRRSFQDYNGAKNIVGHVNTRMFLKSDRFKALKYLNIGGSFNVGYQTNPVQPPILTTANDETAASNNAVVESLSPTFLAFNNNVLERGESSQWAAHAAWYHRRLSLLAEYGGGQSGYGLTSDHRSTALGYYGYMVQTSYFLTGEQMTRRVNVVKPLRNFDLRDGRRGPGAIEVHARFSELSFSDEVFTGGFADPNLWSNKARAIDIGLNWYLNFYTKLYLDWQHSEFGDPVVIAPGRSGPTRDLFWIRFQVFF